jgi:hypothetical protein
MDIATTPAANEPNAVDGFSRCHAGILHGLEGFAGLPALQEAAEKARRVATGTLELLDHAVLKHHAEEEEELFPAVIRSARPGAEREHVEAIVAQLRDEHRDIEALWSRLRADVAHAADGRVSHLNADAVQLLVEVYGQHAAFEEREFLPLAQEILGRNGNHMAALGMSLHMRHVSPPIGYI